jgi:hypothetical protein
MKCATLVLVTLALLLGGVGQAKAGFIGSTVDVSFFYPNIQTLYQDFGKKVVNPTATWSLYIGESTTITNTQILYYSPPSSGTYASEPFNGYVYDFLGSGNLITGVTVDPSSTLSGFNSSYVKLTSDGAGGQLVELNLGGGLPFGANASVVLDVTASASAVPEPASFTLLGIGAAGLLGYGGRRRKRAKP